LPGFRARAAAVLVDVSVRARNSPVEDLRPEDFELRDNGIVQRIESLDKESLPIDMTIVADYFDAGGSARGVVPGQMSYAEEQRAQLKVDVMNISALLGTGDRLRVIEVENEPYEVRPLRSGGLAGVPGPRPGDIIGRLSYMRNSAIYDAVAIALMRFTPMGRRHMVLTFTEGVDDGSVLTKDKLLAIAARADAVMHLSKRKTSTEVATERVGRGIVTAGYQTLLWPGEPTVIGEVARATGGTEINSLGGSKYDDIRRIIDRLRQSYLLRYQPTGVAEAGWHEIQVRVLNAGKYDIQARKGYWGG